MEPSIVSALGATLDAIAMRIDRRSIFPVAVREAFAGRWPGFADLSPAHQNRLAALLCSAFRPRRFQHSRWDDAIYYPFAVRDSDFGRGGFQRINERLRLFSVTEHYQAGKYGKGYRATTEAIAILEKINVRRSSMIDSNGLTVKTAAQHAIRDKDSAENHRTGTGNIPAVITVDIEAMIALRDEVQKWRWHFKDNFDKPDSRILESRLMGMKDNRSRFVWLNEVALPLITISILHCDCDYLPRGQTEIQYCEAASGRLYTVGPSLQTDIRELRKVALPGLFDYDVENCHFSLIAQLANRCGLSMPVVDYYLANKKAVRMELAEKTGAPIAGIKNCLIALIYGARTALYIKGAITKKIGKDSAALLFQQQTFADLSSEIKRVRKPIIAAQPKHRGRVVNPFGKAAPLEVKTDEELLAFVLQGAEASILHSVIQRHGSDLRLLVHDGWVSATRLDAAALQAEIAADTGFAVELEEAAL